MTNLDASVGDSEAPPLGPVAFFINVEDVTLESWYGPTVNRTLLSAVLDADYRRRASFRTYSGNLLPRTFRIADVNARSNSRVDERFEDDCVARFALVCDLCDSAAEGWSTLDQAQASWLIFSNNIYLVVVSAMSVQVRRDVDRALSNVSWYLGAMEIDPGNPIHQQLFELIPTWTYHRGWIGMDEGEDVDPPDQIFEGIKVDGFAWTGTRPELPSLPPLRWTLPSARGKKSAAFLKNISRQTHNERLLHGLHNYVINSSLSRPLSFRSDHPAPNIETVQRKLCGYVLDPLKGKGKAELFRLALGIVREDWRFLAAQLVVGLATAEPRKLRDGGYGDRQHLQYEVTIPIVGRNGKVKPVKVVWKILDDNCPELVTAYLDDAGVLPKSVDPAVLMVGSKPGSAEYCEHLWEAATRAGNSALSRCVPAPLVIESDGGRVNTFSEGMLGGAWVRVPDARRGLARWLIHTAKASYGHPGALAFAPSPSADRARVWADAVTEVFRANGQNCSPHYWFD